MSDFNRAIPVILKHEGHLSNNPNDPGGVTNYGISLRFLESLKVKQHGYLPGHLDHPGDVTEEDIKTMTVDEATQIYKSQWWDRYHYGDIHAQIVATKIFDTAVNTGETRAATLAQETVNELSKLPLNPSSIKVDGVLGPVTIAAINHSLPFTFIKTFQKLQATFYTQLYKADPVHCQDFLKGWLSRAFYEG